MADSRRPPSPPCCNRPRPGSSGPINGRIEHHHQTHASPSLHAGCKGVARTSKRTMGCTPAVRRHGRLYPKLPNQQRRLRGSTQVFTQNTCEEGAVSGVVREQKRVCSCRGKGSKRGRRGRFARVQLLLRANQPLKRLHSEAGVWAEGCSSGGDSAGQAEGDEMLYFALWRS